MLKLTMTPAAGENLCRHVGDRVRFTLSAPDLEQPPRGWTGMLRTTLGRARALQRECILRRGFQFSSPHDGWRDIPMRRTDEGWELTLTLTEEGWFQSKAFVVAEDGRQIWPGGHDVGLSVHPDFTRTGNMIYCAFTRLFGSGRSARSTESGRDEARLADLQRRGFAVLPPSGKLRDLAGVLPHIINTLGFRYIQLLPITPTPTTYARFGRFGSPYACQDLIQIDPALIDFDQRTTGVQQFEEFTDQTHELGGRVLLDMVINHTGWGSRLQETHPEWFARQPDGTFQSPGAWGVTWEDLVELDPTSVRLWDTLADAFLVWCRRGVDGFRCDAGYKVPLSVWEHIRARVQLEFPRALFFLEGLGGSWELTETLLTRANMQWAYSELFQEYHGPQVAGYLDHSQQQSRRSGLLVHFSETHDNPRLASKGVEWATLRNRLCALTSLSGGFGITCGVEWLAAERINVHRATGLAWGNRTNLVPEISRLNRLLAQHPCFFENARVTRLSPVESQVYALRRDSEDGDHSLLVLVNTDIESPGMTALDDFQVPELLPDPKSALDAGDPSTTVNDLLLQPGPSNRFTPERKWVFELEPGAAHCLSLTRQPQDDAGEVYRKKRAAAAWAIQRLGERLDPEHLGSFDWRRIADWVGEDPIRFLSALSRLDRDAAPADLLEALKKNATADPYPPVIVWTPDDRRRVTPVPPGHWLLIFDSKPFRASVHRPEDAAGQARLETDTPIAPIESILTDAGWIGCLAHPGKPGNATLSVRGGSSPGDPVSAPIRFLDAVPDYTDRVEVRSSEFWPDSDADRRDMCLLTNGIGGMCRIAIHLGAVHSKYDCLLGANLHPRLPVDRHVFAKRVRVWAMANGFLSPLNHETLRRFEPGPPARWIFDAPCGGGATTTVEVRAHMEPERNETVLRFRVVPPAATRSVTPDPDPNPGTSPVSGVSLTIRVDIEDRSFHQETQRNPGSDHHFSVNTNSLSRRPGFEFRPAADRRLTVFGSAGRFHAEPEWTHCPHPIEASRGQVGHGDAYSPGWFHMPIQATGAAESLVVSAERDPFRADPAPARRDDGAGADAGAGASGNGQGAESTPIRAGFVDRLRLASADYVVRRDDGHSVVAGYPWFLDWGRDTLICARGLLAAGRTEAVEQMLVVFGRFEENGTLPNSIHGDDASNRDTSDAPLWYGVVCEDLAALEPGTGEETGAAAGPDRRPYAIRVHRDGRTVADVLRNIAEGYRRGTPNGIRMDPDSALIWSPSHFTWMDTNYPAGTPREGYPIEIQALWVRLLRQLARLDAASSGDSWQRLADRAAESINRFFWIEKDGYYADLLIAGPGQSAATAARDNALRSNATFLVSLGIVQGERARRSIEAARRYLVVPGAIRSLAPRPVFPPLPIQDPEGQLLNDPDHPYWGRYEGDEDTRRKPAYHNGTAWVWPLASFCEALALAWDMAPDAVRAARSYMASVDQWLGSGCVGHLPEILDGDAPHTPRGCDAQAWSVTETLRVWKRLDVPRDAAGEPFREPV